MSVQEMINTPGYYYSLAYWLAAFIVTCTNEKRIQGIKRYVTHLIFLAAIVGFMEITDGVRTSLFLPCMLVSVSLFLIYIYRCCQFHLPRLAIIARERLSVENLPHLSAGRFIIMQ